MHVASSHWEAKSYCDIDHKLTFATLQRIWALWHEATWILQIDLMSWFMFEILDFWLNTDRHTHTFQLTLCPKPNYIQVLCSTREKVGPQVKALPRKPGWNPALEDWVCLFSVCQAHIEKWTDSNYIYLGCHICRKEREISLRMRHCPSVSIAPKNLCTRVIGDRTRGQKTWPSPAAEVNKFVFSWP